MLQHLQTISRAIGEEIGTLRQRVCVPVAAAIALTEREALAAAEVAYGILAEAKTHHGDVNTVLQELTNASAAGSKAVAHVIRVQSATFGEYTSRIRNLARDLEKAVALTLTIAKLGKEVDQISSALRLLTLNAQMESARFGPQGKAFGVIANEMRTLSLQAQKASHAIGGLATDLSVAMPLIADQSSELLSSSDRLSRQLTDQVQDFENVHQATQRSLHDAVRKSSTTAQRLADRTGNLIQHLQFHDRVAQGLHVIEEFLGQSESVMSALFRAFEQGDADFDVDSARSKTRRLAEVAVTRLDDSKSAGGYASGDVDFL